MRRFDVAIFDLDGTLLNTYKGVREGVLYLIEKYELEALSEEQLSSFVGPPIKKSLMRIYGIEEAFADIMQKEFREYYSTQALLKAEPYEGLRETIKVLQNNGIYTAVATYKREDMAKELLSFYGIDEVLNSIHGSDAEGKLSKSDIIKLAIAESGIVDYKNAVMIGDTDNDAIGSSELGVPFIGVTYGFGFRTKNDVDNYANIGTATKPEEILDYILKEV